MQRKFHSYTGLFISCWLKKRKTTYPLHYNLQILLMFSWLFVLYIVSLHLCSYVEIKCAALYWPKIISDFCVFWHPIIPPSQQTLTHTQPPSLSLKHLSAKDINYASFETFCGLWYKEKKQNMHYADVDLQSSGLNNDLMTKWILSQANQPIISEYYLNTYLQSWNILEKLSSCFE